MSENEGPVKFLLSRQETAYALATSVAAVDGWKRSGDLNAVYIDSKPRYDVDEVRRFAKAAKGTPPA